MTQQTITAEGWIKNIKDENIQQRAYEMMPAYNRGREYTIWQAFCESNAVWSSSEGQKDYWEEMKYNPPRLTSDIIAEWEREYKLHLDLFYWLIKQTQGEGFEHQLESKMKQVRNYLNQKHGIEHTPKG